MFLRRFLFAVMLVLPLSVGAQVVGKECDTLYRGPYVISWIRTEMDGSRTGCSAPGADNAAECLGVSDGRHYVAPNGHTYNGGSTPKVARILLDNQAAMADVKRVVGYSEHGMWSRGANTPLANFACDAMLDASEELFGRRADLAILNSGGIRGAVPAGDVLKDDIVAIFPFRNYVVLVEWPGTVLQAYVERIAKRRFAHPYAGLQLTLGADGVVSCLVGGKPVDPSASYYLVTIDFLLGTGDNMRLADGASDIRRTQTLVFDVIMDQIMRKTAAGQSLDAAPDDRFIFIEK